MDERAPASNPEPRRSGAAAVLERFLRKCENPRCMRKRTRWPFSRGPVEGARLQGRWYCSGRCFEQAAADIFLKMLPLHEDGSKRPHRIPIGLLLLSRGVITEGQLKEALSLQRNAGGGPIGRFLRRIEAVNERELTAGLAAQWGCPVYPLESDHGYRDCAELVPKTLIESAHMLPVRVALPQKMLYVAFDERIDRTMLYAVEQMLRFRTIPCIVAESAMREALGEVLRAASSPATVFESPQEPREMARTTHSYALQLEVSDVWIARSGRFVWVRLFSQQWTKDILFQTATSARAPAF